MPLSVSGFLSFVVPCEASSVDEGFENLITEKNILYNVLKGRVIYQIPVSFKFDYR